MGEDSVVIIPIQQYRVMTTCPIILSECEQMRQIDRDEFKEIHNNTLEAHDLALKKNRRKNIKNSVFASLSCLIIGFITGVVIR